jgi:hypothetical protein
MLRKLTEHGELHFRSQSGMSMLQAQAESGLLPLCAFISTVHGVAELLKHWEDMPTFIALLDRWEDEEGTSKPFPFSRFLTQADEEISRLLEHVHDVLMQIWTRAAKDYERWCHSCCFSGY